MFSFISQRLIFVTRDCAFVSPGMLCAILLKFTDSCWIIPTTTHIRFLKCLTSSYSIMLSNFSSIRLYISWLLPILVLLPKILLILVLHYFRAAFIYLSKICKVVRPRNWAVIYCFSILILTH